MGHIHFVAMLYPPNTSQVPTLLALFSIFSGVLLVYYNLDLILQVFAQTGCKQANNLAGLLVTFLEVKTKSDMFGFNPDFC